MVDSTHEEPIIGLGTPPPSVKREPHDRAIISRREEAERKAFDEEISETRIIELMKKGQEAGMKEVLQPNSPLDFASSLTPGERLIYFEGMADTRIQRYFYRDTGKGDIRYASSGKLRSAARNNEMRYLQEAFRLREASKNLKPSTPEASAS